MKTPYYRKTGLPGLSGTHDKASPLRDFGISAAIAAIAAKVKAGVAAAKTAIAGAKAAITGTKAATTATATTAATTKAATSVGGGVAKAGTATAKGGKIVKMPTIGTKKLAVDTAAKTTHGMTTKANMASLTKGTGSQGNWFTKSFDAVDKFAQSKKGKAILTGAMNVKGSMDKHAAETENSLYGGDNTNMGNFAAMNFGGGGPLSKRAPMRAGQTAGQIVRRERHMV